ncbi:MAG: hypothetical protein EU529_15315 [Promethearchaeota archaeon]|nr:MAG: hypothetical protein EU529_15315 [Candidatus Lokiarchaeota archaeon]
MLKNLDRGLLQNIYNSNEFKGWLLSRRWFGDKSVLSNLEFKVNIEYFAIISERIFLNIIKIETSVYSKSYFLPLIYYKKIQDILKQSEKNKDNVIRLTEITFSKKVALTIGNEQKIFTLNLLEAEYCLFFWKKILFDKDIIEEFPTNSLELSLYTEQFQDDISRKEVQNLIEASLFPNRYNYSLQQLGAGNTTNTLFLLTLDKKMADQNPVSFVLKSYKVYSESLEPSILYVLVKNNFPNAPKIYGTIKIKGIETLGIIESVQNIGNIGAIVWNELNDMIYDVFKKIDGDYSHLSEKSDISNFIKKYFVETLKISEQMGIYINKLHESLILPDEKDFNVEIVDSENYLRNYTEKLNSVISELQNNISQKSEKTFYNLPKIKSILIDISIIIEKFRSEFEETQIKIQPVHQDLHMEQILYNKKDNGNYDFCFIDFEGDPQLKTEEKKRKFPVEKDLASLLRSLSYIKFNTLLNFIEKKIIQKYLIEVPEEILYSLYFRKALIGKGKVLETVLKVLNVWEEKIMRKIIKTLNPNITLTNYFTIERTLHELNYELLFRPNKTIVPILGLKEIIEKY